MYSLNKNATKNQNHKIQTKLSTESAWAEDMGQFLYYLDPNTRKITRRREKLQLKMINKVFHRL